MSAPRVPVAPTGLVVDVAPDVAALAPWADAGVFEPIDLHVAGAIARLTPEADREVLLAAALAVRAIRLGHVCIVLDDVAASIIVDVPEADADGGADGEADGQAGLGCEDEAGDEARSAVGGLDWPDPQEWARRLRASAAVRSVDASSPHPPPDAATAPATTDAVRPLVFDGERVYLERYWRYERTVGDALTNRAATSGGVAATPTALGSVADHVLDRALDAVFGPAASGESDRQREAGRVALTRRVAVIAGGPGTGKTRTVARLLIAAFDVARATGQTIAVALCAPTGKAAARMTEALLAEIAEANVAPDLAAALAGVEASTIHRLLGPTGTTSFRHDRANPLPADLVIVDETSMVSLPLMAKLADAVRPEARLVLVGDPYQLASIEAGAVLGDVVGPAAGIDSTGRPPVGPLADTVVVLERIHRFGSDSPIARLADAVRRGDADGALAVLTADGSGLDWVRPDDLAGLRSVEGLVAARALEVVAAASSGDRAGGLAASRDTKVLAATRRGTLGADDWQVRIERALGSAGSPIRVPGRGVPGGRAAGSWYVGRPVIVTRNDYAHRLFNGDTGLAVADGTGLTVAFSADDEILGLAPSQLSAIETWWSMTIHKSQGSEFRHVVVSLPAAPSPILTRELLYTAITRARQALTIVADEGALRHAIARPVARASGLAARLWP